MKTSYRSSEGVDAERSGSAATRSRFGEQAIKVRAVRALGALLELRVDVHSH